MVVFKNIIKIIITTEKIGTPIIKKIACDNSIKLFFSRVEHIVAEPNEKNCKAKASKDKKIIKEWHEYIGGYHCRAGLAALGSGRNVCYVVNEIHILELAGFAQSISQLSLLLFFLFVKFGYNPPLSLIGKMSNPFALKT